MKDAGRRLTNVLLTIIALCLALLVVEAYTDKSVAAQEDMQQMIVYGLDDRGEPVPVRVRRTLGTEAEGALLVSIR